MVFIDVRLTAALLDRLTYHRPVIETGSESFKVLRQKTHQIQGDDYAHAVNPETAEFNVRIEILS